MDDDEFPMPADPAFEGTVRFKNHMDGQHGNLNIHIH